jgi:hypothetical protein
METIDIHELVLIQRKKSKYMTIKRLISIVKSLFSILRYRNFILITIESKNEEGFYFGLRRRTDYTDESDLFILSTVLEKFEQTVKEKENG